MNFGENCIWSATGTGDPPAPEHSIVTQIHAGIDHQIHRYRYSTQYKISTLDIHRKYKIHTPSDRQQPSHEHYFLPAFMLETIMYFNRE